MDEFEVFDGQSATNRLKLARSVERLYELASMGAESNKPSRDIDITDVVGGQGIDIGSPTICHGSTCRSALVDSEFLKAFHYFDNLVIEGPSGDYYTREIEAIAQMGDPERFRRYVADDVEVLQYLRDTGVVDYVKFVVKPAAFCAEHFTVHATELGFERLSDRTALKEAARKIVREGKVEIRRIGEEAWHYDVHHPTLDDDEGIILNGKSAPPRYIAVLTILTNYLVGMVSDLATAKMLRIPLASTAPTSFFESRRVDIHPTVDDVASRISLPYLQGLNIGEFLRFREDERDGFIRFRESLRCAIGETIDRHESSSPLEIAQAVRIEYIEPALADIQRRLKASTRSVLKKVASGLAIGGIAAIFGSIEAMPLVVAAGVAAAATPIPQLYKYYDDRRDIELDDIYFLWKATNSAQLRANGLATWRRTT